MYKINYLNYQDIVGPILIQVVAFIIAFSIVKKSILVKGLFQKDL